MFFEEIREAGFIDTTTFEDVNYAIQILVKGKWYYAAENGKPFFFNTAKERDKKIEDMKVLNADG